jgi:hypothetical protein
MRPSEKSDVGKPWTGFLAEGVLFSAGLEATGVAGAEGAVLEEPNFVGLRKNKSTLATEVYDISTTIIYK